MDRACPNAILLDLMMPGMDGWAFRAAQRQDPALADIPVVVLSATSDVQVQARPLGPAAVFAKPFDLQTLLDALQALDSRPSATDASRDGAIDGAS